MNNILLSLVRPALQSVWSPEAVDVGTELASPQSSSPHKCAFCHAVVPQDRMNSHLYSHFSPKNEADNWHEEEEETDGSRPRLLQHKLYSWSSSACRLSICAVLDLKWHCNKTWIHLFNTEELNGTFSCRLYFSNIFSEILLCIVWRDWRMYIYEKIKPTFTLAFFLIFELFLKQCGHQKYSVGAFWCVVFLFSLLFGDLSSDFKWRSQFACEDVARFSSLAFHVPHFMAFKKFSRSVKKICDPFTTTHAGNSDHTEEAEYCKSWNKSNILFISHCPSVSHGMV